MSFWSNLKRESEILKTQARKRREERLRKINLQGRGPGQKYGTESEGFWHKIANIDAGKAIYFVLCSLLVIMSFWAMIGGKSAPIKVQPVYIINRK